MRAADPSSQWTNTHELIASLIEVTDYGNRLFYAANAKKGSQQPKPLRIPRPGQEDKPKKASSADVKRFFGRKR